MKQLRDYQGEDRTTVLSSLQRGMNKQLAVWATGLGKTLFASHIINDFHGRALWLTHTEELIDQSAKAILRERMDVEDTLDNHDTILQFLDDKSTGGIFASPLHKRIRDEIGIIKQHRMDTDAKVQVASVQTLHRRLHKIRPDYYDVIVCDEAHLFMAPTFQKVLDHFKPQLRLGLTATPDRTDGLSLANLFDDITVQRDIKFGIDNGYLVPLNGIRVRTGIDIENIKTIAGDFSTSEMETLLNTPQRNKLIAESWKKYCEGRPTIGFCVDVKHARDITEVFQKHGIRADFVVADEKICPDRTERIKRFKQGKTDVLFNVMILTAGFDFPDVSCIIMARPTKSRTLFMQAIGRGTRPLAGVTIGFDTAELRVAAIQQSAKKELIILDIVDATNKHSLINTFSLDKGKPVDEQLFISREERIKLKEAAKAREVKLYHEQIQDEKVRLILPESVKVRATASTTIAASEAQMKWMRDLGMIEEGAFYSVRDISEMILKLPATDKQIWRLNKEGFDVTGGVTRGQAEAAFLYLENNKNKMLLNKLPISDIE